MTCRPKRVLSTLPRDIVYDPSQVHCARSTPAPAQRTDRTSEWVEIWMNYVTYRRPDNNLSSAA